MSNFTESVRELAAAAEKIAQAADALKEASEEFGRRLPAGAPDAGAAPSGAARLEIRVVGTDGRARELARGISVSEGAQYRLEIPAAGGTRDGC